MSSTSPLSPTFYGHIASTQDALILFEACLTGQLNHVARRPHDRERANLIKSGNVFIYEEHSSGIKRWTDGVPWSPSRILGNFLVYRELERPFPPGEKKRAMKRSSRRSPGISKSESFGTSNSSMSNGYNPTSSAGSSFEGAGNSSLSKETERALIGSLIDSYGFKDDGLVKKTVSVTVGNVSHHLVSYYTVADVTSMKLSPPSKDPRFQHIQPRPDLIQKQNFRTPLDEIEPLDRSDDRNTYPSAFSYPRNAYEMTNQTMSQRQMPLPAPQMNYAPSANVYQSYGLAQSTGTYDSIPAHHPNNSFGTHFAPSQNMYPVVRQDGYDANGYRPPQRYNSVIGIGSDASRTGMPSSAAQLGRRASAFEQTSPLDASLVGASSASLDSKMASNEPYSTSPTYYGNIREDNNSPQHHHSNLRSLPNPGSTTTYDRAAVASTYPMTGGQEPRDNIWSPLATAGSGHGHYMPSHHPWGMAGQQ